MHRDAEAEIIPPGYWVQILELLLPKELGIRWGLGGSGHFTASVLRLREGGHEICHQLLISMISRNYGLEGPNWVDVFQQPQRGASSAESGARWSRRIISLGTNLGKSRLLHSSLLQRYITVTCPMV
jgi:hypothetical protein